MVFGINAPRRLEDDLLDFKPHKEQIEILLNYIRGISAEDPSFYSTPEEYTRLIKRLFETIEPEDSLTEAVEVLRDYNPPTIPEEVKESIDEVVSARINSEAFDAQKEQIRELLALNGNLYEKALEYLTQGRDTAAEATDRQAGFEKAEALFPGPTTLDAMILREFLPEDKKIDFLNRRRHTVEGLASVLDTDKAVELLERERKSVKAYIAKAETDSITIEPATRRIQEGVELKLDEQYVSGFESALSKQDFKQAQRYLCKQALFKADTDTVIDYENPEQIVEQLNENLEKAKDKGLDVKAYAGQLIEAVDGHSDLANVNRFYNMAAELLKVDKDEELIGDLACKLFDQAEQARKDKNVTVARGAFKILYGLPQENEFAKMCQEVGQSAKKINDIEYGIDIGEKAVADRKLDHAYIACNEAHIAIEEQGIKDESLKRKNEALYKKVAELDLERNLKSAIEALEGGNLDEAIDKFERNIDKCRTNYGKQIAGDAFGEAYVDKGLKILDNHENPDLDKAAEYFIKAGNIGKVEERNLGLNDIARIHEVRAAYNQENEIERANFARIEKSWPAPQKIIYHNPVTELVDIAKTGLKAGACVVGAPLIAAFYGAKGMYKFIKNPIKNLEKLNIAAGKLARGH